MMVSEIVKEIHRQLTANDSNVIKMMSWGAHDFVAVDNNTLRFRVDAKFFSGYVDVIYDQGWDLYNVAYLKIENRAIIKEKLDKGLYHDQLVEAIDAEIETGIYNLE